jgi:hypothetical protein
VLAIFSLLAPPAMGRISAAQQKQIEIRESTGVSNSEKQLDGLKRDQQIDRQIFAHRIRVHRE